MSNTQQTEVALVTGAARGIGAATARRLAREGFAVVINYSSSEDAARAALADIEAEGGRGMIARADVSDAAAVAALFDAVQNAFGGIDVLVNNAGVMHLAPIGDMTDADFDRLVAINFKGTFNVLREASSRLRDGARVINLSSSVTRLRQPGYGAYAATKAATEALAAVFSKEMRGRHIRVNAIAPGPTATDLFRQDKTDDAIARIAQLSPLERLGEPADIAAAIAMLASPNGTWINGQTIHVNGGVI